MGLIGKLLCKAEAKPDFSIFNEDTFNIRKSEDKQYIEVFHKGKLVERIFHSDVYIKNEQLASDWFWLYDIGDVVPCMAECEISKSADIYYVRCNTWVPRNSCQFPSRIPVSGKLSSWLIGGGQAFIRYTDPEHIVIKTPTGEEQTVTASAVMWTGSAPEDRLSWYICKVDQIGSEVWNASVVMKAPADVSVIVDGVLKWNMHEQGFM